MDERQINYIKAILAKAGIVMIPEWIAQAAIRRDPHLQVGVACSQEMTLGDIADLGES